MLQQHTTACYDTSSAIFGADRSRNGCDCAGLADDGNVLVATDRPDLVDDIVAAIAHRLDSRQPHNTPVFLVAAEIVDFETLNVNTHTLRLVLGIMVSYASAPVLTNIHLPVDEQVADSTFQLALGYDREAFPD